MKRLGNTIRYFLRNEAAGGLILMASAVAALIIANSSLASGYFDMLHMEVGPLSLQHWINDALMAVFFLMVGLEIKREMMVGHLSTWSGRLLPCVAAFAGMLMPALVFLVLTLGTGAERGWAIPAATDIAFALGVMSLLGSRVPTSLKIFLVALAIIDDLGAILVIGIFYTETISWPDLMLAGVVLCSLTGMNRSGIVRLWPYLSLGALMWYFTLQSGVHATLAGVLLALTVPLRNREGRSQDPFGFSPLHRLEIALVRPVAFLIIPVFGFVNAGVSFSGIGAETILAPVTMGVAAGLFVGKFLGIFGAVAILVRSGIAELPNGASWWQMFGTTLLCGIGFTMSLFISMLAFGDAKLVSEAKIGILIGSLACGFSGYVVLQLARRKDEGLVESSVAA